MGKGISVIDILIGFLVLAVLLGVFAVFFVMISGIEDVFSNFGQEEASDVPSDSSDLPSNGVGGSTSKGHVLKLGDAGLKDAFIESYTDGAVDGYYYGYYTNELKANTRYRVSWKVESRVKYLKNISIPVTNDNGSLGYYFILNTSYSSKENAGDQRLLASHSSELLDSSWEFTTENKGDTVTFFMFYIRKGDSVTTAEDANLIGVEALKCVESITFEEIVEG